MNISRLTGFVLLLMLSALPGAWAGLPSPVQLPATGTVSMTINGVQITAGCSGGCPSNEELVAESTANGQIAFEIVGDAGTAGSTQSYALTDVGNSSVTQSLAVNFTISDASNLLNGWSLTTTGDYDTAHSTDTAGSSAAMSSGVTAGSLSAALTDNNTCGSISSPCLQTPTSPSSGFTSFNSTASSFAFTDTLSLYNSNYATNNYDFNIMSSLITFRQVPEPATLSVLLVGLAGLAATRRARGRSRKAA